MPRSARMLVWWVFPSPQLIQVAYCSSTCPLQTCMIMMEWYCCFKPCSINLWTIDTLVLSYCHALCIIGLWLFVLVWLSHLASYSITLWAWYASSRTSGSLVMLIIIKASCHRWIQLMTGWSFCVMVGPDCRKNRFNRRCTQQWQQFIPVTEGTRNKPIAHIVEGLANTFKPLRTNCSRGIIRSLEWIFDLNKNSEKTIFEHMKQQYHNRHPLHDEGNTYKQAVRFGHPTWVVLDLLKPARLRGYHFGWKAPDVKKLGAI
jgi:hypothetical protein